MDLDYEIYLLFCEEIKDKDCCIIENCNNKSKYKLINFPKQYCFFHKTEEMFCTGYCLFQNCMRLAIYGNSNDIRPSYCRDHKLPKMKYIYRYTCGEELCHKRGIYKYKDGNKYCDDHRKDKIKIFNEISIFTNSHKKARASLKSK